MKIEWRVVKGHPDYEVSNTGLVRNITARMGTWPGRILSARPMRLGHSSVCLYRDKKAKMMQVHRLVAFAFIGKQPSPKHEVAHIDGNALNNHVSNLKWATRAENEADKVRHGKSNRGSRHGMSKLTEADVTKMRKLAGKYFHREIAKMFGVNRKTAGDIINLKRWRHV